MEYPPASMLPARVAEFAGYASVWLAGSVAPVLLVRIKDLPKGPEVGGVLEVSRTVQSWP